MLRPTMAHYDAVIFVLMPSLKNLEFYAIEGDYYR